MTIVPDVSQKSEVRGTYPRYKVFREPARPP